MNIRTRKKRPYFFSYKVNRRILLAFFLIIAIPVSVSFGITTFLIRKTVQKEIETRLVEGATVYFKELETIEQRCLNIARAYAHKTTLITQIKEKRYDALEEEMVDFYRMGLIDIIEIENTRGEVIFRGHNPILSGDIKMDQQVVRESLAGKTGLSYEGGKSGFAVRAAAPILSEGEVVGIFMAGSLFSREYVSRLKNLTLLENGIYRGSKRLISTYEGFESLDGETVARLRSGESLIRFNSEGENASYHMIFRPIFLKNSYWGTVALGIDRREAEKAYLYTNDLLVYILLFSIFIAVLIYSLLARSINSSLKKIITGITSFSFDNPNAPIEMKRSDEFKIIADNYNTLIDRLELYKKRINRLQNDLVKSTRLATAGQVAAELAHEIRNPLSSIKMMSQIISTRFLKEGSGKDEMSVILEEIERINSRVVELLEFARPGKMDFLYHDIHTIIQGVLKLCRYDISRKNIDLSTQFDQSLPELYADGEKVRICILNIVLNAIQVMEDGGTLRIRTQRENDTLVVEICNSGSLVEHNQSDTLFEPFFSNREGGTGLGLTITKMLIERHGGRVEVRSDGEMVCFSIHLPLKCQKETRYGHDFSDR